MAQESNAAVIGATVANFAIAAVKLAIGNRWHKHLLLLLWTAQARDLGTRVAIDACDTDVVAFARPTVTYLTAASKTSTIASDAHVSI